MVAITHGNKVEQFDPATADFKVAAAQNGLILKTRQGWFVYKLGEEEMLVKHLASLVDELGSNINRQRNVGKIVEREA